MPIIPIVNFSEIKKLPTPPVLTLGCEGECCGQIKLNKINKPTVLYFEPDRSSKIIGTLKKDETFNVNKTHYYTRINQFGSALLNGKKVDVLMYQGEGNVLVYDGKKSFYPDECLACTDEGKVGQKLEDNKYKYHEAKTEKWININYGKNLSGWTNEENFELSWCQ